MGKEIFEFRDNGYSYKVECTLRPDGMYDAKGDIVCSNTMPYSYVKMLEKIHMIHTLYGNLKVAYLGIDSSMLIPIKNIQGDCNLFNNKLTTLKGSPEFVSGNFLVNSNKLQNLQFSPLKVNGDFYCLNNELKSIEGGPIYVGGNCNFRNNPDLRFTRTQLNAMNTKGKIYMDPEQLVPDDPSEFIEKGILPI